MCLVLQQKNKYGGCFDLVAIKKTNTKINDNLKINEAHIYVTRPNNARVSYINWKKGTYGEWHWTKYNIKETDMRTKTASFTSPNSLDLTTGVYLVLITSPMHEDFGGVIISVEYDETTGLYTYQCQDYSRFYQGKFEAIVGKNITQYRLLQYLITRGGIDFQGKVSKKKLKEFKNELSGLRPAYQYDQKYWGNVLSYNMMTQKNLMIFRDKSWIEAIRDLVYGSGSFIDVHFDKYGTLHLEPYYVTDLFKTGLYITTPEIAKRTFKFDTTDIITGVNVQSTNKSSIGKFYFSTDLVKLDLSAFFGRLDASITNPNTSKSTSSNKSQKKSTTKTTTNNPYNTKRKAVEISSDNINSKSKDKARLNEIAKLLRKNGWEVINHGVGSNMHSERHLEIKNGVHFCLMGGVDAGMIREVSINSSYVKKQKRLNSRTVWAWLPPASDIRKGGKRYAWMPRSDDDNYSPRGFKGVEYPSKKLIKAKVPFMYGSNAEEIVAKFLKGGDEPDAC